MRSPLSIGNWRCLSLVGTRTRGETPSMHLADRPATGPLIAVVLSLPTDPVGVSPFKLRHHPVTVVSALRALLFFTLESPRAALAVASDEPEVREGA